MNDWLHNRELMHELLKKAEKYPDKFDSVAILQCVYLALNLGEPDLAKRFIVCIVSDRACFDEEFFKLPPDIEIK